MENYIALYKELNAYLIFIGNDFWLNERDREQAERANAKLVPIINRVHDTTTKIIKKIVREYSEESNL